MQDSSYIQQNQDKTPQNNRIETSAVYPHQVHSLQRELQKQVLQEGYYSCQRECPIKDSWCNLSDLVQITKPKEKFQVTCSTHGTSFINYQAAVWNQKNAKDRVLPSLKHFSL